MAKITREELSKELLNYLKNNSTPNSENVTIKDLNNIFNGNTLEEVLLEINNKFNEIDLNAKSISFDDSTSNLNSNDVQSAIDSIVKNTKQYINDIKPVNVKYTLKANKWIGTEYSLEEDYPFNDYDIEISIDGDLATEDIVLSYSNCIPVGYSTKNVIKIINKNEVPKIDIPVVLRLFKK